MRTPLLRVSLLSLALALPAAAEIVHPDQPPGVEPLVKDWLLALGPSNAHLLKRPLGEIRVEPAMRLYSVGPVLREDTEFVSRMSAGAWRFPVLNDGTSAGLAIIAQRETTDAWEVAGFNDQPAMVDMLAQALAAAAQLPQVLANRYEARTAIIHGGEMIQTLWLHSENDDLFIPYGKPYPTSLWRPLEVYSQAGIIACAQTKAMQLHNMLSYGLGPLRRLLKAYREEAAKTGDTRPATLERLKESFKDELSVVLIESAEREMPRARIRYHPPGPDTAPDELIATIQEKGCLAGITLDGSFKFYREQPTE